MTQREDSMADDVHRDIVYALAAAGDLCFAARHSGLWRSDDGGSHWQTVNRIESVGPGLAASALALSPDFQSDGNILAGIPGGVLRSSDSGKNWTIASLAAPPPFVSALAVSPAYAQDGVVFAATLEDGIFCSDDSGATWRAWNFGLFDRTILCIAVSPGFAQDRTVYVGTEIGIFCSKNGGRAWHEIGFPLNSAPVLSLAISPQFSQSGVVFAGTEDAGLFYSDDRGQTWQQVLSDTPINAVLLSPNFPTMMDVLAVSNDALWYSCDGGQSWLQRQTGEKLGSEFTAVVASGGFTPDTKILLGMADGQIVQV